MNYADRLARWNSWYDHAPESWRFQMVVLWPLLAIGAINMLLTIAIGFPFGLLVLLGIAALAAIRVPHVLGWVKTEETAPRLDMGHIPWMYDLNTWYDGLPEFRRFLVFPAVLVIAGAINMMLTIGHHMSFGILVLIALLAMVVIRVPYVAGWLSGPSGPAPDVIAPAPATLRIEQHAAPIAPMTLAPEPAPISEPLHEVTPIHAASPQHELPPVHDVAPIAGLSAAPSIETAGEPAAAPPRPKRRKKADPPDEI